MFAVFATATLFDIVISMDVVTRTVIFTPKYYQKNYYKEFKNDDVDLFGVKYFHFVCFLSCIIHIF